MARIMYPWKMIGRYEDGEEINVSGNNEDECMWRLINLQEKHGELIWYSGMKIMWPVNISEEKILYMIKKESYRWKMMRLLLRLTMPENLYIIRKRLNWRWKKSLLQSK